MNILALDLGTKCGYAILRNGDVESGTKKLPKKTFGSRFSEFRRWLIEIINEKQIDVVCFERVRRHIGTEAAHVFGGFMYVVAAVCDELNVQCEGVSVGTIKKFMTGKGNAGKDEMIAAAQRQGFDPVDDNEADALGILLLWSNINQSTPLIRRGKVARVLSYRQKVRRRPPRLFASGRCFLEDDTEEINSDEV